MVSEEPNASNLLGSISKTDVILAIANQQKPEAEAEALVK